MPVAYWVGRICKEFRCLPSEAERELQRQSVGWIEEVIESIHYTDAYHFWTTAKRKADVPDSPLMDRVKEIEFELVADERAAREAKTPDA